MPTFLKLDFACPAVQVIQISLGAKGAAAMWFELSMRGTHEWPVDVSLAEAAEAAE